MEAVIVPILKSLRTAVPLGILIRCFEWWLDSKYFEHFLSENLVMLLAVLLGVNLATLGIIVPKLHDVLIANNRQGSFASTSKQMRLSVYEQVTLIGISLVLLIALASPKLCSGSSAAWAMQATLNTCFVYGMLIMMDTAKTVFTCFDLE